MHLKMWYKTSDNMVYLTWMESADATYIFVFTKEPLHTIAE